MRAAGESLEAIADTFGVSKSTACRWTTPGAAETDRAGARAWKAANRDRARAYDAAHPRRAPCDGCGFPRGMGSQSKGPGLCHACRRVAEQVRRDVLAGMWRDGWPVYTIAAVLGVTIGTVRADLWRLRRAGVDLPYRIPAERLANLQAGVARWRGERVAA